MALFYFKYLGRREELFFFLFVLRNSHGEEMSGYCLMGFKTQPTSPRLAIPHPSRGSQPNSAIAPNEQRRRRPAEHARCESEASQRGVQRAEGVRQSGGKGLRCGRTRRRRRRRCGAAQALRCRCATWVAAGRCAHCRACAPRAVRMRCAMSLPGRLGPAPMAAGIPHPALRRCGQAAPTSSGWGGDRHHHQAKQVNWHVDLVVAAPPTKFSLIRPQLLIWSRWVVSLVLL